MFWHRQMFLQREGSCNLALARNVYKYNNFLISEKYALEIHIFSRKKKDLQIQDIKNYLLIRSMTRCHSAMGCLSDPVHTKPSTLENRDFFSEYGYRPDVTGVFGARKRRFSNTLSRVESFENRDSSYSCGRAKTEVFKYDDVMHRFKARSSAHTIRKRYVWTQIFLIRRKNPPFSKIPGCVRTRP